MSPILFPDVLMVTLCSAFGYGVAILPIFVPISFLRIIISYALMAASFYPLVIVVCSANG